MTPPEFVQPLGAVYSLFAAVEQPVKAALHRARLDVRAHDIRRCGVQLTGGQETIRAVVPRPAERVLVGIADAQTVATLAIERLGWSHGHPVEWRHTIRRHRPLPVSRRSGTTETTMTTAGQIIYERRATEVGASCRCR